MIEKKYINFISRHHLTLIPLFLTCISCVTQRELPRSQKTIKNVSVLARKEDSGPRKRVVILPFIDERDDRPLEWKKEAEDKFMGELNLSEDVIALNAEDLKITTEKYFQGGQFNLGDMARESKDLGVSAFLEGKILDIRVQQKTDAVGIFRQMKTTFEVKVKMRLASAKNGRELFNTTKTVTVEESNVRTSQSMDLEKFLNTQPGLLKNLVSESFLDFEPQIRESLSKIVWEGRIAGFSGDRIFLNVGRISGLQVGDVLKVSEEGDEIFDPQSGQFIGKVPGRIKGTLEVVSYFGQDGSVAVIHSGAGFKENDRVEIY